MPQHGTRRRFSLVVLLLVLATLAAGCVQPAPLAPPAAPADVEGGTAGGAAATQSSSAIVDGGTWTEALYGDASNFNPVLVNDADSALVTGYLFPSLIAQDPNTGAFVPAFGAMAESWTVSEDGLTWTFQLREGVTWSDGDPVDSADYKFTYDALRSENVQSPRTYVWDGIASITAPDAQTVVVQFEQVKCDALANLGLNWLPSHLYAPDFSDVMAAPENEAPRVSAGPLLFQSWERDDAIMLVRNEGYWEGAPHLDGTILRVVPDPGARLAQLQSGEVDFLEVQPNQIAAAEQDPDLARFRYDDDGFLFLSFNLADPGNPQPGRDEAGNLLPQDPHPILGDVRVRQAIAHAIDYQSLIDNIQLGQGRLMAANVLPMIDWAVNQELQPYAYDLDAASALLEEAGWIDSDGDGIREKEGVALNLSLLTNAGNSTREDLGVYIQDQLKQIGVNVDFQALDFGTVIERWLGQTYDMVISGWTGVGGDPNDQVFWSSEFDAPGSGFNAGSYQNARVEDLLVQGYSVPGCAPADRAPAYQEIQQIIHDELPYIFLSSSVGNIFYNQDWTNIEPGAWNFRWNLPNWYKQSLQPVVAP